MRARYYDPAVGRFVSQDSAQDGRNWFAYCKNDPINRADPSGLFSIVDLGADAIELDAEGEEAAQSFGILTRISKLVAQLQELTDTIVSLETNLVDVSNSGILDKIEALGGDPNKWFKAYQFFETGIEGGFKTIEVHTFVQIENGVINAILLGETTPWLADY